MLNIFLQKETSTGTHVFLEDKSSNGTFVNGEKVGKCVKDLDPTDLIITLMPNFIFSSLEPVPRWSLQKSCCLYLNFPSDFKVKQHAS